MVDLPLVSEVAPCVGIAYTMPRRDQLDKKGSDENSHDEVNEYERDEILDISRHDSILAIRENKLVDRWSGPANASPSRHAALAASMRPDKRFLAVP